MYYVYLRFTTFYYILLSFISTFYLGFSKIVVGIDWYDFVCVCTCTTTSS
jgi:hypothetical protein